MKSAARPPVGTGGKPQQSSSESQRMQPFSIAQVKLAHTYILASAITSLSLPSPSSYHTSELQLALASITVKRLLEFKGALARGRLSRLGQASRTSWHSPGSLGCNSTNRGECAPADNRSVDNKTTIVIGGERQASAWLAWANVSCTLRGCLGKMEGEGECERVS